MSPSKQDILSEYYGHDQSVARKLGIALDVVKPFPNHLHIMSQEETGRPRTSSSQVWWSPELESWDHLTTAFENNEDCVYDTLLPFVDSYVPEIVVPEVETTNLEHSPSAVSEHSPNCISSASSSVVSSALTPSLPYRRLTKEDIEADSRLRNTVQTVSELRKSRRRAQNRTAQQAFKARKNQREKELLERIKAIEESNAQLRGQNEVLNEDLVRLRSKLDNGSSPDAMEEDAAVEDESNTDASAAGRRRSGKASVHMTSEKKKAGKQKTKSGVKGKDKLGVGG